MTRLGTTLFIALGTGSILLGSGLVFRARALAEWDDCLERACEVRDSFRNQVPTRSVLDGPAIRGSAFGHYARAVALAGQTGWERRLWPSATPEPDADQQSARTDLARRAEPAMEELLAGARSRHARFPLDWEALADPPNEFKRDGEDLADLALTVAFQKLKEGRPSEGTELLLAGLQFGRDLLDAPLLFDARAGANCFITREWIAFGEQGGWSMLPPEHLARVEESLAQLDQELETVGPALLVDESFRMLQSDRELHALHNQAWVLRSLVAATAPFFQADSADEHGFLMDFAEDYRIAQTERPRRALELTKRRFLRERGKDERDRFLIDLHAETASMRLRALARLRLLRTALARSSGREEVPETDRLGYPIQSEVQEGMLEVTLETPCATGLVVRLPQP